VIYDLKITDFRLPPLSLEPLIENAVKYGTGLDSGVITISTEETPTEIQICVADNGTGDPAQPKKPESTGIGLSNTRQRLSMICGGTLSANRTDSGMKVTITIPKRSEVTV
jgi:LytS/YehU family sensor histidine kinase